jgi:hypothetical protein
MLVMSHSWVSFIITFADWSFDEQFIFKVAMTIIGDLR